MYENSASKRASGRDHSFFFVFIHLIILLLLIKIVQGLIGNNMPMDPTIVVALELFEILTKIYSSCVKRLFHLNASVQRLQVYIDTSQV